MEEENKNWKRSYYIWTIIIGIVVAFLSSCITYDFYSRKDDNNFILASTINEEIKSSKDSNEKISKAIEAFRKQIDKHYIGEIDEKKLLDYTLKGYVEGLEDEYSEYMTAEEWEEYQADSLGNYVGIGIYMSMDKDNNVVVVSPIKDTPAEKAGLKSGDIIVGVNEESVIGKNSSEVSNLVKGEEGTKVKIKILRDNQELDFELTRRKVITNPIEEEVIDKNIGYLAVTSFDEGTGEEFKTKFEHLKSQNIKSLIIDLRNNGGGLVSEALEIADYIIEKGQTLLVTVDKNNNEEITKAKQDPTINMPIVVLVNENTASASEILAGALKDNKKAILIGTKTYGKGVIQQILTLQDGSGLKITVEEYFTPSRNKINKIGIEPDEVIELPEHLKNSIIVERKDDLQLNRAIEILKNK